MIRERNVIEVEMRVLRLERAPAAVEFSAAPGLHADDPFAGAGDGLAVRRIAAAMQEHGDDGGIVHIGIMRVFVLERPSARPQTGTADSPIAGEGGDLFFQQPLAGGLDVPSGLDHRMTGEAGVPDGRQAGLAVRAVLCLHQQFPHRPPGDGRVRVVWWITERVEHHHAVGDGGIDAAQSVVAVEAFGDEGDGFSQRVSLAG